MLKFKSALILVALASCATSAHAANDNEPLADCVDLSAASEMARFGSQYLLVKDGDAHYRIGFGGGCSAIALSTNVKIVTDGQANRLCPKGTRVAVKKDSCAAREVLRVDEREYEIYARKRR